MRTSCQQHHAGLELERVFAELGSVINDLTIESIEKHKKGRIIHVFVQLLLAKYFKGKLVMLSIAMAS